MISEVVMPQMGADMTEGTVLRWLKHEGESVGRGEIIAEIETDKANVEIEAFEGGTFRRALAEEGDVVQVGEVDRGHRRAGGGYLEVRTLTPGPSPSRGEGSYCGGTRRGTLTPGPSPTRGEGR